MCKQGFSRWYSVSEVQLSRQSAVRKGLRASLRSSFPTPVSLLRRPLLEVALKRYSSLLRQNPRSLSSSYVFKEKVSLF
jgi:hypothetical protein